jgi:hypothetical protein
LVESPDSSILLKHNNSKTQSKLGLDSSPPHGSSPEASI